MSTAPEALTYSKWLDLNIEQPDDPSWCALRDAHTRLEYNKFFMKYGIDGKKLEIHITDDYPDEGNFNWAEDRIELSGKVFREMSDREKPAYIARNVGLYYGELGVSKTRLSKNRSTIISLVAATAVSALVASKSDNGFATFAVVDAILTFCIIGFNKLDRSNESKSVDRNADNLALEAVRDIEAVEGMIKRENRILGIEEKTPRRIMDLQSYANRNPERYGVSVPENSVQA